MKKVFALMAIAAMFAVACSKDDDNKKDDPKPDPKPVDEYTGPVEGTSEWSLIGDLLEKSWDTDWVAAQDGDIYVVKNVKLTTANAFKFRKNKDWGENRGAEGDVEPFVMTTGEGTPVVHNGKNLSVAADGIYDIYYNSAKEQMAVCEAGKAPTWKEGGAPGPVAAKIAIDGTFDDWSALKDGTYSKTFGDEDAPKPALTKAFVYADPDFIYVYFEWNPEYISAEAGVEHVPFHCYINTDGDETTGGYADQFSDACSDVLLEGYIYPDGVLGSYDPGAYKWIGEPNASGWGWAPDTDNLFPEGGLGEGAGVEGKYEFKLDRAMFANVGLPVADVFSIGFDIQQSWESVGILPSVAPDESNPSGVVNSLKVTTQK